MLIHDEASQEISDIKEKRKAECSDCGKILVNRQVMERHKKSVHSDVLPFKCAECDKCFKQSGNLKLHIITHSDERSFPCSNCNQSFKRQSELNKHVKKQACMIAWFSSSLMCKLYSIKLYLLHTYLLFLILTCQNLLLMKMIKSSPERKSMFWTQ